MTTPPLRAVIIPVTPLQQNCTLIWCTATMRGAVVDPGGDRPKIVAAAEQHGVKLEKILLTHGHIDHAGAAGLLSRQLDIPIEGPEESDRFWIARLDEDGRAYGIEGQPFEPDRWLADGDTVTIGELTLDVYHTPGHTPGHIIFHHAPSRFAQVGDVIFQGSIGRTDFPLGHHQTLLDTIVNKLWPLGDETAFVCGHGTASTFAHERRTNPFVGDAVLGRG